MKLERNLASLVVELMLVKSFENGKPRKKIIERKAIRDISSSTRTLQWMVMPEGDR